MKDKPVVTIKAHSRIKKFNETQDPEQDEPFEVSENEKVLVGQEAEEFLKKLNGGEN